MPRNSEPAPDGGFTLIELCVVMVIISALAAIAIPLFGHQRDTGYHAQLTSDLHSAAIAEEAYALAHDGSYLTTGTADDLAAQGFRATSDVAVSLSAPGAGSGFCLSAAADALTGKPGNPTWYTNQGSDGGTPMTSKPANC